MIMNDRWADMEKALDEWMHKYNQLQAENEKLKKLCEAAKNALRSYEHGNGSDELAKEIADALEQALPAPVSPSAPRETQAQGKDER